MCRSPKGKSVKRPLDLSSATPPSPPKKQGTPLPENVVAQPFVAARAQASLHPSSLCNINIIQ